MRPFLRSLAGLLLCGLGLGLSNPASAQATPSPGMREAFLAFFPMYEMARLRQQALSNAPGRRVAALNQFGHARKLLDHRDRSVTAPNNDTLYSSAWLDLSLGPVIVEVPDMGKRYYSLHFMNIHTDNIAILGQRNAGGGPLRVALVPPGWTGPVPVHSHRIDADSNDLWLLIRTLVDDQDDVAVVTRLQDAMRLLPPRDEVHYTRQKEATPIAPTAEQFVAVVDEFLQRNPPRGRAAQWAQRAQALGIGPQTDPTRWSGLGEETRKAWNDAWPTLRAELLRPQAIAFNRKDGWNLPPPGVGQWGDRIAMRATVALRGIGALDSDEAMYLNTLTDKAQQPLDGQQRYRMRIPAGGIPVQGFWSVTMYQIEPDGRFFFAANPIGRYSIGNRTRGLVANGDGSIDILMQADAPDNEKDRANWLPTPRGPFRLSLRAYLPSPAFVQGQVALPDIERIGR